DPACRRMLGKLIEAEDLGEIVGEKDDGLNSEAAIIQARPDIVLVDLLMPRQSGLEVVENLRKRNFPGGFIMISQIESKEMVAQAYAAGIEFFIHKPINRIEVVAVIKKVMEQQRLHRSLNHVRESLRILDGFTNSPPQVPNTEKAKLRANTMDILGDLGIIGEAGSKDLLQIVLGLGELPEQERAFGEVRYLKELYSFALRNPGGDGADIQAVEQRIRRTIKQAMENIAALGIEDYHDPKFERYAGKYFDFVEVRRKMRELEKREPGESSPRINIRKFIEALLAEVFA
ncbi:MAG TPA: response regulator, partial [Verrucomicrobiae bacterium]|nr:response regulator [Verrucomicrobiae bacterium]